MTILYYSCTQEKEFVNEHNHPKINYEEKSFKEALGLSLFNDALKKVAKKSLALRSEDAARTAIEEQYGFTIVTDAPINIISRENGTILYTILIEREVREELVFENLVIKVEGEETTAGIFKYVMTEKGIVTSLGEYTIQDISSTIFTDLNIDGKIFIDTGNQMCFSINVVRCNIADHRPAGHIATQTCWNEFALNPFGGSIYNSTDLACVQTGEIISGGDGGASSNNTGGLGGSGGESQPIDVVPIPCRTNNCMELDNLIPTPCETLNDLFSPTKGNILNTMAAVNTSAFGPNQIPINGERGAYFTKSGSTYGQHIITPSSNGTSNYYQIDTPTGLTIYAAVHSHPIEGNPPAAPMFSYSDLETLVALYRATSEENKPHVVYMLILPDGNTYAIKVDDFIKLASYLTSYNNIMTVQTANNKKSEKNRIFDNKTKNGYAEGQDLDEKERRYTRGFLDEMKNHGVSLYRKTTTSTTGSSNYLYGWEKLKPPVNPTDALIQETPCN